VTTAPGGAPRSDGGVPGGDRSSDRVTLPGEGAVLDGIADHGGVLVQAGRDVTVVQGDQFNAGGDQHFHQPGPPPPGPVRAGLPQDTAFTGREAELEAITGAVQGAARTGGVMAVHVIVGMPGVGKTALAVHAAHRLADRFPEGRLFLDLHAHTAGVPSTESAAALAALLVADGVDARYLPDDLDGRAALWRDRMAAKAVLLVLDNAASSDQVRPLLPGNPECLALITSRRHLGDLSTGTVSLLLDRLPTGQARAMFGAAAAPRSVEDGPQVVELVELCGCLPLAISILARVYAQHPSWALTDLIAETEQSLLHITAERDSVAAAFDVSIRYLPPARRRFLALLGLHPGASIDPYAAAALTDITRQEATAHLVGLWRDNLLTEPGRHRYGMHDLIRTYAQDLAADTLTDDERDQALDRVLDHYRYIATDAARRLTRRPWPQEGDGPASRPSDAPTPIEYTAVLAAARAERANLTACLDHASTADRPARIVALTTGLAPLLRLDGPWTEALTRHATALSAAQHLGDRSEQARALTELGNIRRLTADYDGATEALDQALRLYRQLGYPLGQANVLNELGVVRRMAGDRPGAIDVLEQALLLYEQVGNRYGQANALHELGVVRLLTGGHSGALELLERALFLYQGLGNQLGRADALSNLGNVRRLTGDHAGAIEILQQAVNLHRELGNQRGQARTLNALGDAHHARGEFAAAGTHHQQSLELSRHIGSAPDEAHALVGLGRGDRQVGRPQQAARLLGQALEILTRIGAAEAAEVAAEHAELEAEGRAMGEPATDPE
jgi:tetratricopeptide (TPR) repeat protein